MCGKTPDPYTYTHWNWVQESDWSYTTITAMYNTITVVVYERIHHNKELLKFNKEKTNDPTEKSF